MNVSYAPIALFVFNRPEHTRRTVDALRANVHAGETDLFVFCDAARDARDASSVGTVREFVRAITTGFRSCTMIAREKNLGLAASIIGGVSEVLRKHDRVIVMEDDLVTSPFFLPYMNEALEYYQDDDRVASIHGYVYPTRLPLPETFFLRGADCWGWATWRRGWALFNPDGRQLLSQLQAGREIREFDFDGAHPYTAMLRDQIRGANNSWAIRWYASAFLKKKVTLYPGRSLVINIGIDASGTNCGSTDTFDVSSSTSPIRIGGIPVEDSPQGRAAFIEFGRRNGLGSPMRRRLMRLARTFRLKT
jgi:hypothetical protein